MEVPVCPGCGRSRWESVAEYTGGSKRYELRAAGWMLIDDWLELDATDYRCRECGYDPAGVGDDELWEVLNDIDTAPSDAHKAKTAEDVPLTLWEDDRTAA
jgi:hypothetical protein